MAFGASILVNRALKPVRNAVGEVAGEIAADCVGATGRERQRIINNTRRVVNIGGSLAVSGAMGDLAGAVDAVDALAS